jgi:hypothetical protein
MADYLIAGICLSRGSTTLLTRNRADFERIPELRLGTCPANSGTFPDTARNPPSERRTGR